MTLVPGDAVLLRRKVWTYRDSELSIGRPNDYVKTLTTGLALAIVYSSHGVTHRAVYVLCRVPITLTSDGLHTYC